MQEQMEFIKFDSTSQEYGHEGFEGHVKYLGVVWAVEMVFGTGGFIDVSSGAFLNEYENDPEGGIWDYNLPEKLEENEEEEIKRLCIEEWNKEGNKLVRLVMFGTDDIFKGWEAGNNGKV